MCNGRAWLILSYRFSLCFVQAQKAYHTGLLFTHSREESAPAWSCDAPISKQESHISDRCPYYYGCVCTQFIRYSVNLALIVCCCSRCGRQPHSQPWERDCVADCYFTLLHPSKLYYVTYKRLCTIQMLACEQQTHFRSSLLSLQKIASANPSGKTISVT